MTDNTTHDMEAISLTLITIVAHCLFLVTDPSLGAHTSDGAASTTIGCEPINILVSLPTDPKLRYCFPGSSNLQPLMFACLVVDTGCPHLLPVTPIGYCLVFLMLKAIVSGSFLLGL